MIREFSTAQGLGPTERTIDTEAPAGLRNELVGLVRLLAGRTGLADDYFPRLMASLIGVQMAGNPSAGPWHAIGRDLAQADWTRVYDLLTPLALEFWRHGLFDEFQADLNRILAGYGIAWDLGVPVRTFADWKDPTPGYLEADLVVHCGGSVAGSFVHTLTLTDIASGWTECVALVVREGALVVEALRQLQTTMPFPLRGLDTDNGGEFLNDTVLKYCTEQSIEFTRSRPYRKNDQAWVEQKNGSVVRRLVGYGRLEGIPAAKVLARLYAASRLFVNFFQPSFKLAEKTRVGARVTKRYHPPATPCARLMASAEIPDEMKDRLRSVLATLDPLRLLDEIRAAQHHLVGLITGETPHVALRRDADCDCPPASVASSPRADGPDPAAWASAPSAATEENAASWRRGCATPRFASACSPQPRDLSTGYPVGITAGPDGNIWFTERFSGRGRCGAGEEARRGRCPLPRSAGLPALGHPKGDTPC